MTGLIKLCGAAPATAGRAPRANTGPALQRSGLESDSRRVRIPQYDCLMADTTRITVTLPNEQVAELRKITDNVSGYVAEAVARQLRHQLLGADLLRHQEEHGEFTEEELAQALVSIFGTADSGGSASVA